MLLRASAAFCPASFTASMVPATDPHLTRISSPFSNAQPQACPASSKNFLLFLKLLFALSAARRSMSRAFAVGREASVRFSFSNLNFSPIALRSSAVCLPASVHPSLALLWASLKSFAARFRSFSFCLIARSFAFSTFLKPRASRIMFPPGSFEAMPRMIPNTAENIFRIPSLK